MVPSFYGKERKPVFNMRKGLLIAVGGLVLFVVLNIAWLKDGCLQGTCWSLKLVGTSNIDADNIAEVRELMERENEAGQPMKVEGNGGGGGGDGGGGGKEEEEKEKEGQEVKRKIELSKSHGKRAAAEDAEKKPVAGEESSSSSSNPMGKSEYNSPDACFRDGFPSLASEVWLSDAKAAAITNLQWQWIGEGDTVQIKVAGTSLCWSHYGEQWLHLWTCTSPHTRFKYQNDKLLRLPGGKCVSAPKIAGAIGFGACSGQEWKLPFKV